jgi:hypothetical protein
VSRRVSPRCINEVDKRVDLVFVVTAFSTGWLRESHVSDLLWSNDGTFGWFGVLMFQFRHALLFGQLAFELVDAFLWVVLIHQQMVPPRNRQCS